MEISQSLFQSLEYFMNQLGWHDPIVYREHKFDDGSVVPWCECGNSPSDGPPFLQINFLPCACGCVYVPNYKICTGFHEISLTDDGTADPSRVDELRTWLLRDHFTSDDAAKRFIQAHPECGDYRDGKRPPYWITTTETPGVFKQLKNP